MSEIEIQYDGEYNVVVECTECGTESGTSVLPGTTLRPTWESFEHCTECGAWTTHEAVREAERGEYDGHLICDDCGEMFSNTMDVDLHDCPAGDDDDDPKPMTDGGTERIRDSNEVRHSDDAVRYVNNPDGTLYAYREDGKHVVVSRGNEPNTRWTKRVSAERTAVAPGEQLWTIPDNWQKRVTIDGDWDGAYAIYKIPEERVHVLVTIPKNCHLVDKWYGVKRVGDVSVTFDDSLATEGIERAIEATEDIDEVPEATREELERLRDRPNSLERRIERNVNEVAEDAFFENVRHEPTKLSDWTVEPWKDSWDFSDIVGEWARIDGEALEEFQTILTNRSILPRYPHIRIDVEEGVGLPEDYYLRGLIQAGCTPTQAVDYLMVEIRGRTQSEWAEERGVDQGNVSRGVNGAKRQIQS